MSEKAMSYDEFQKFIDNAMTYIRWNMRRSPGAAILRLTRTELSLAALHVDIDTLWRIIQIATIADEHETADTNTPSFAKPLAPLTDWLKRASDLCARKNRT